MGKTIEFYSEYMEKTKPVGVLESQHDKREGGKGSRGLYVITPSLEELQQAHLYILNNNNEVLPRIVRHKALVKESNPKKTKNKVLKESNAFETLRKLADGPKRNVITWQGYDINKYSFYTRIVIMYSSKVLRFNP